MPSTALKLKENLQTNVPKILTIKKRVGSYDETDFTTKQRTGGKIHLYIFHDETGTEFKHYLSDRDEELVGTLNAGQQVQVIRREQVKADGKRIYFIDWGIPGSAEMNAAPQLLNNTALQRQERQNTDHQAAQKVKEVCISLQGLTQAYISTGNYTKEEAVKLAVEARELIIKTAIDISSRPQ